MDAGTLQSTVMSIKNDIAKISIPDVCPCFNCVIIISSEGVKCYPLDYSNRKIYDLRIEFKFKDYATCNQLNDDSFYSQCRDELTSVLKEHFTSIATNKTSYHLDIVMTPSPDIGVLCWTGNL